MSWVVLGKVLILNTNLAQSACIVKYVIPNRKHGNGAYRCICPASKATPRAFPTYTAVSGSTSDSALVRSSADMATVA